MTEALWLLLLIAACCALSFWAGRASNQAYLQAAQAVSSVTNAVAAQSNDFTSTLDKSALEAALLKRSVERLIETTEDRQRAVEDALGLLIGGFQRANVISTARPGLGKQVGEDRPE